MEAMEAELSKSKSPLAPKAHEEESDEEMNIDDQMAAELQEALKIDPSDLDETMEYGLLKNFLESYKSQAGEAGPVSNLAGRLGTRLPSDADA